jgi:hypothetical protein
MKSTENARDSNIFIEIYSWHEFMSLVENTGRMAVKRFVTSNPATMRVAALKSTTRMTISIMRDYKLTIVGVYEKPCFPRSYTLEKTQCPEVELRPAVEAETEPI